MTRLPSFLQLSRSSPPRKDGGSQTETGSKLILQEVAGGGGHEHDLHDRAVESRDAEGRLECCPPLREQAETGTKMIFMIVPSRAETLKGYSNAAPH